MNTKYQALFSPIQIGKLTLKNRIIYAPYEISQHAPHGIATMDNFISYEHRAQSGAALLVQGETIVHPSGNSNGCLRNLYNEEVIPGLLRETSLAHRYGAVASVSLCHHGGRTDPAYTPDHKMYGPSEVESLPYTQKVTPLDEEMMQVIIDAYANAALMAKTGGYDMVTIHAAHGFLPAQFLSRRLNKRTDEYGGSLENRARFAMRVIDAIKARCGQDYPIEYRMSGDDFMEDGSHLDEMKDFAMMLDGKVDLIHISASSFWDYEGRARIFPSGFLEHGCNVYMGGAIKSVVKKTPVAVVGALTPEIMERVLEEGKVDMVAAARSFWADPYWPEKLRRNQEDDIMPCVRCNLCISTYFYPFVPFVLGLGHCSVNPHIGREWESKFLCEKPEKRRVLIIGGGPGGMQAAVTAADRGHEVILCDDRDQLGGGVLDFIGPDFKEDYRGYLNTMKNRIAKRAIDVRLNTHVTPEMARAFKADVIIAAIGGEPKIPPIEGIDDPRVVDCRHFNQAEPGQRVVVIGAGSTGAEEALSLAQHGRTVTLVAAHDEIGTGAPYVHWQAMKKEYEKPGAPEILFNTRVTRITAEGVWVRNQEGEEKVLGADSIYLASGLKARAAEAEMFRDCAEDFFRIGDCRDIAMVYQANRDGYDIAMGIGVQHQI